MFQDKSDENAYVAQAVADDDDSESEEVAVEEVVPNGHQSEEAAPAAAAINAPAPAAAQSAGTVTSVPRREQSAEEKAAMALALSESQAAAAAAAPAPEASAPEPEVEPEPEPVPEPEQQKTTRSGRAVKARDVFNAGPAPPPSRIRAFVAAHPGTLPSEVSLPPEERRRSAGMLKCEREGFEQSAGNWLPRGTSFRRDGPDSVWVQVGMRWRSRAPQALIS
jgi:hypothetical protein